MASASRRFGSGVPTSNIGTLTVGERPCPFTPDGISPQRCCARSRRTSVSQPSNSWGVLRGGRTALGQSERRHRTRRCLPSAPLSIDPPAARPGISLPVVWGCRHTPAAGRMPSAREGPRERSSGQARGRSCSLCLERHVEDIVWHAAAHESGRPLQATRLTRRAAPYAPARFQAPSSRPWRRGRCGSARRW